VKRAVTQLSNYMTRFDLKYYMTKCMIEPRFTRTVKMGPIFCIGLSIVQTNVRTQLVLIKADFLLNIPLKNGPKLLRFSMLKLQLRREGKLSSHINSESCMVAAAQGCMQLVVSH